MYSIFCDLILVSLEAASKTGVFFERTLFAVIPHLGLCYGLFAWSPFNMVVQLGLAIRNLEKGALF